MTDLAKAVRYNATAAEKYGWANQIPAKARADYPGLGLDPVNGSSDEKTQFASAVLDYQTEADPPLGADGMLGPSTWDHIEEQYGDETVPVDWNVASAVNYNQRSAQSVGWYGNFPQAALDECLGWKNDAVAGSQGEKEAFAATTHQFQADQGFGPGDTDGKLGPHTWDIVNQVFADPLEPGDRYYIYKNRRVKADGESADVETIPYDQAGGLDLHKWGHFSSRNGAKPRLLVIHWGGIDPNHLYRVFSSPTRKVSSHGGIGRGDFYQMLDFDHSAWHAGYVNRYSIGIDICQQPTTDWLSYYQSRSYDLDTTTNTAKRPDGRVVGNKSILSLDPATAKATRQVVFDICSTFDIPMNAPRGSDGLQDTGEVWHGVFPRSVMDGGQFTGVVGHHHLSSQKWDMACWWGTIFDGTELGD